MKLSRTAYYAIRALAFLAAEGDSRPVASRRIAQAEGIPELFLLKLLRPLALARILWSLTGPNGGYWLARPASEITLLEIVEAVAGPIRGAVPFVAGQEAAGLDSKLQALCDQDAAAVRGRLGKVTLAKLIAGT